MEKQELIPHLFRTEYRKIVSVLCKRFGLQEMEAAEDLASDTFVAAAQAWPLHGIPDNPVAWLYATAKNKTRNYLQRQRLFNNKISPEIARGGLPAAEMNIDLSDRNIDDSQLQMMFAVCHPSIPAEAQIGLCLRILCGFGIGEIADAFLTSKETVNKRLFRAKEKLRSESIAIALPPPSDIEHRLETVLATIYLLFNEGYYSASSKELIRKELCFEAMRLCTMLTENPQTNVPAARALLALMCFQASRLDARTNEYGETVLYEDQDTRLWDNTLVERGAYFLHCAAVGQQLSRYHLEGAIAYWSTQKTDSREKWESVLQLYDQLLQIHFTPIAALNRTFALFKIEGPEMAIVEAERLNLTNNRFYFMLLSQLYSGTDDVKARAHLLNALDLAKNDRDRQLIQKQIDRLQ